MRQKRIQSQGPKRILGEKADTKADYLCISWCYHTSGEWSRCPRGDNHSYWWCYVQQYSEGGEAGATKHKEIRNSSRNFRLSWSFSYHHICILMICTKKKQLFFCRNLALTISIQLSMSGLDEQQPACMGSAEAKVMHRTCYSSSCPVHHFHSTHLNHSNYHFPEHTTVLAQKSSVSPSVLHHHIGNRAKPEARLRGIRRQGAPTNYCHRHGLNEAPCSHSNPGNCCSTPK